MKTATKITVLLLCLALASTATAGEDDTGEPGPGYTGTWIRNDDLSDNPADVLGRGTAERQEQGRGPGGMGRGGGGGRSGGMAQGGGRGRGGAQKGGGGQPPTDLRPPRVIQGLARLEIFHEAEEFAVTDANDILQSLYTDGRRVERWTEQGRVLDTATISTGGIVVRSEGESGDRTVTYVLDETGDRLMTRHVFTPPGQKSSVTLKMVYDRE